MKRKNFRFIKHDIIEPLDETILGVKKIDWIYNMACPVSCIDLQVDPVHTVKANVHGVIHLLDLAREHDAVFLQASSADIYGEKTGEVQTETDWGSVNTLSPRACYEEGKRVAETLCMDYHRMYGSKVKIARIFNTSGRGTHISDGRVISNFIFAALQERDLVIYGDGTATRSFLYMDDIIDALDRFMKTEDELTGPINIGNDDERSIKELAETIIKLTNSPSQIVFEPRDDAPLHRRPDIRLAKKLLGWQPTTPFEDNIRMTIDYYKSLDLPDKRILVFATTFYPDVGPAERALADLAARMPQSQFHVVTSKFRPGLQSREVMGNVTVYRLGLGMRFDKYLLPFLGALLALELHKRYRYRFMWSIMPSYGGLAGALVKVFYPKVSFIVADESMTGKRLRSHVAEVIRNRADRVYTKEVSAETESFIETVREDYSKLLAKQEGKLERPR
jgi:UDP-glucuronate decarboxylase